MRHRQLLIAAIVVGVLIPAGYTGYWFLTAASVRDRIADWAEARRGEA